MKRNANSRKNVFGTCKSVPSCRAERQNDSFARRKGSKNMCGNNMFGNNNCLWIIVIIILIACCCGGLGNTCGNSDCDC